MLSRTPINDLIKLSSKVYKKRNRLRQYAQSNYASKIFVEPCHLQYTDGFFLFDIKKPFTHPIADNSPHVFNTLKNSYEPATKENYPNTQKIIENEFLTLDIDLLKIFTIFDCIESKGEKAAINFDGKISHISHCTNDTGPWFTMEILENIFSLFTPTKVECSHDRSFFKFSDEEGTSAYVIKIDCKN